MPSSFGTELELEEAANGAELDGALMTFFLAEAASANASILCLPFKLVSSAS